MSANLLHFVFPLNKRNGRKCLISRKITLRLDWRRVTEVTRGRRERTHLCACVSAVALRQPAETHGAAETVSVCVFEYSCGHEAAVCKCACAYVEGDHEVDFWFSMRV